MHGFAEICNLSSSDQIDISDHFPKVFEDFQNVVRRSYKCLRTFSENFRRLPKIAEEDPKNFGSFTIEIWQTRQKMVLNRYLHM